MELDPHALHLAIRWLHVAAMSVAFGGAVLVTFVAWSESDDLLAAAAAYEWIFWGAIGLVVMTGIGNLGVFGSALPLGATDWGRNFGAKMTVVVALVLFSLPRTVAITHLSSQPALASPIRRRLRTIYGLTAIGFAVAAALAVTLAHG